MRIRSIVATAATALLTVGALAMGAEAATAAPLTGTKIHNTINGIAIGVESNSTQAGTYLRYQTDSDAAGQFWALDPVTPDTYLIRNLNSGMCMSGGPSEGSAAMQLPCDPRFPEQTWSLRQLSVGRYQIVNESTNRCVTPTNAATLPVDNNYVRTYTCATQDNQSYVFDVR